MKLKHFRKKKSRNAQKIKGFKNVCLFALVYFCENQIKLSVQGFEPTHTHPCFTAEEIGRNLENCQFAGAKKFTAIYCRLLPEKR